MAPNLKHKIVGIRPGEKIHELLTSKDEARNVIRFTNHYVITPNIEFKYDKKKYLRNKQGEIGKFVENNFEYNSGTNEKFLSVQEIKKLNQNNSINDTLQSSIN